MNSGILNRWANIASLVVIGNLFFVHSACSQQPAQATTDDAALVIEGRVTNVFQSTFPSKDFLVQILVQKSEAIRLDDLKRSTRYPAPGEYLYAHVDSSNPNSRRTDRGFSPVPKPNSYIRAKLRAGDHQHWAGISQNWYQTIDGESGLAKTNSPGNILGIATERVFLSSQRALKVTHVETGGPAALAGLEVGDILVKANDVELSSLEQLFEQVQKSDGLIMLTVHDVRTGRNVPVKVKWELAKRGDGQRRSLGVTTEIAFFQGKPALKVVKIAKGSPAQKAGIVPGQIILTANGRPLTKPDSLATAEREGNSILELRIFEPKTRDQRAVRVDLR